MHKVISLFTGAGGLDLGLEAAGFKTAVCVEMDGDACTTIRQNRRWPVINDAVQDVTTRKIMMTAGIRMGEASLLAGGPPCQPFSKSGYWHSGETLRMNDPRASTVREYLQVLEETQPEAFLLENVPGFAYEDKAEGIEFLLREIRRINRRRGTNYSAHLKVLNAVNYGVPQRRERLFIVGSRDGDPFKFPDPTHSNSDPNLIPFMTAWDSIGKLDRNEPVPELDLSGKWANLLPSIPEGTNYLWLTKKGGGKPLFEWRSRYWNFLLKLGKDQPSWTILAQPGPATGPFHWRNRRLSGEELCRLQTFPEGYKIFGEYRQIHQQLGNAVPSALAELIGLEIRRQFFGDRVRDHLTLIPKRSKTSARAQYTRPVPKAFKKQSRRLQQTT